jgi:hypothetical protein
MKSLYYELSKPWEPELIGVKDGLSQATVFDKGFTNKQYYKEFIRVFANPNHFSQEEAMAAEFELESVKLKKGAILTDFLWFSPMSYCLVSNKVYNIITKYDLGNHRFFNAHVEDVKGKIIEGYKFFYIPSIHQTHINFRASEFIAGNDYDGYKHIEINSSDDLFSVDGFLKVKKVSLNNEANDLDMFKVKLPIGTLISEDLYKELVAINVSGIKFRKIQVEIKDSN